MKVPADLYEYGRAHAGYFFAWEEDGDVLAVPGGKTICYSAYLFEVLELLAPQGAPNLGTLLLTIIATGIDGFEVLPQVEGLMREVYCRSQPYTEDDEMSIIVNAFSFLKKLHALPAAYRSGNRRLQLIQTIFEDAHNLISSRRITSIISDYQRGYIDTARLTAISVGNPAPLFSDLKPLEILNVRYSSSGSLLHHLASIPEIEAPSLKPDGQATESRAPKDFIEELEAAPETFHIGTLVRRIWSGLAIPFHSNHPSLQPLGGVSDLSNKGELDKLLLSEHANEEILFLSRLANGEALYVNRETPPETDKLQRIIMIDASLQSWGTPRALAFALMIAIARHPKTDISCVSYAVGNMHRSLKFSTVHELIDSLQLLDTSVNAAAGLEQFFQTLAEHRKHEIIFISATQGYKQSAVQRVISEWAGEIAFCITADSDGAVSVLRRRGQGFGLLQRFTLPLTELWKNPPSGNRLSSEPVQSQAELPSEYPILFPAPSDIRALLTAADGQTFAVTKEKTILRRWKSGAKWPYKGWAFVRDNLPTGECRYEIGLTTKGEYLLLCNVVSRREVCLINLNTRAAAVTTIDSFVTKPATTKFTFRDDGFILREGNTTWRFQLIFDAALDAAPAVRLTQTDLSATLAAEPEGAVDHLFDRTIATNTGAVLKNIKRVCISYNKTLMLNQHELHLASRQALRFKGTTDAGWIPAKFTAANRLEFPDGSAVTINRNGMLFLDSSDSAIPRIYIPTVLDAQLGVATNTEYAGGDFYNPELVPESRRLTAGAFYNRFIEAFTAQIARHATSIKAD